MRIAIDARLWAEPRSGIGRYTRSLTEHLRQIAPEEHWIHYVDRPPSVTPPGIEIRCLPWPQRLVWSLWHAPRDLRRRPVDVFHGVTGFELPPRGPWALVTTVHDLVPLRLPALVPARHRWAVRCLLGGALRRRAAGDRRLGRDPRRAPRALSPAGRRASRSCRRRPPRSSRPPRPRPSPRPARGTASPARTCSSSASSSRRRTWATLLEAVARLRRRGAWGATELVIVGAFGWGPDPGRAHPGAGARRRGPLPRAGPGRRPAAALRGRARLRVSLALGGLRAARARGDGGRRAGRGLESGRPARADGGGGAARRARRPSRSRRRSARSSATRPSASGCAPRAWRARPSSPGSAPRARRWRSIGRRRHEPARRRHRADGAERLAQGRGPGDAARLPGARHRRGAGARAGGVREVHLRLRAGDGAGRRAGVRRHAGPDAGGGARSGGDRRALGGGGDAEARAPGPGRAGLRGPAAARCAAPGTRRRRPGSSAWPSRSRRSWRTAWPCSPAPSGSSRSCGSALVEKGVLVVAGFAALALGGGLLGVASAFVLAAAVSLGLTVRLIDRRLARLDARWNPPAARGPWRGSWRRSRRRSSWASPPRAWRRWSWRCSPATWPPATSGRRSASTTSCGSCPSRWSPPSTRSWRERRPATRASGS